MKKVIIRIVSIILCIILFVGVFVFSMFSKVKNIFGGELFTAFAMQGAAATDTLTPDEFSTELFDVRYIKADGSIDSRQFILYTPTGAEGALPLIYIPHYAAEETTSDFVNYIRRGWAVAAAYDFKIEYNGVLETDDLVFNSAALYTLRHMDGIDRQRIATVGGSAGGYMTMMLNGLQMGTVAAIASSPVVNPYFNFHEYFPACDEVNGNSGLFNFTMPIQGMVSKAFQPINDIIAADDVQTWEAVAPISMARAYSNPVVITHNTSDILVPVDQLTHQYTYDENDGTLPKGFDCKLPSDYPGILSMTFEELANPDELTINYMKFDNHHVEGDMPYGGTLITINVNDDGAPTAKGSHNAPDLTGSLDIFPYLDDMMSRTLAQTEKLVPEKLLLLLERYQGKSIALPAHEGVDDTLYGSLAVYRQEIVDELNMWMDNHSAEEMDAAMQAAIKQLTDTAEQESYLAAWREIMDRR